MGEHTDGRWWAVLSETSKGERTVTTSADRGALESQLLIMRQMSAHMGAYPMAEGPDWSIFSHPGRPGSLKVALFEVPEHVGKAIFGRLAVLCSSVRFGQESDGGVLHHFRGKPMPCDSCNFHEIRGAAIYCPHLDKLLPLDAVCSAPVQLEVPVCPYRCSKCGERFVVPAIRDGRWWCPFCGSPGVEHVGEESETEKVDGWASFRSQFYPDEDAGEETEPAAERCPWIESGSSQRCTLPAGHDGPHNIRQTSKRPGYGKGSVFTVQGVDPGLTPGRYILEVYEDQACNTLTKLDEDDRGLLELANELVQCNREFHTAIESRLHPVDDRVIELHDRVGEVVIRLRVLAGAGDVEPDAQGAVVAPSRAFGVCPDCDRRTAFDETRPNGSGVPRFCAWCGAELMQHVDEDNAGS